MDLRAAPGSALADGGGGHAGLGKAGGITAGQLQLAVEGDALDLGEELESVEDLLAGGAGEVALAQGVAQHVEVDVVDDLLQVVLVGLAVLLGALQADLLAAAPDEADGAVGLVGQVVVEHLHNGHTAGGVVPGAGGPADAVVVGGEDHLLLGHPGAGDDGDHVVGGDHLALGLDDQAEFTALVVPDQGLHVLDAHTHTGELGALFAAHILGPGLLDQALVVPQSAVDAHKGQCAQLLEAAAGLGVDHAVGDGDLTLNIAQGGVAGVLNVDKGGHDALVGGRAAPANADDVVGLSVLAQNGQLHLVDGGLDDLIGLQPSLDARLLADGLEELGGPFLVLGTGHALEGESLQGLPCAFFVDRHTCILPSFL